MITSAPTTPVSRNQDLREYFAGVKWTGNVRPVDDRTQQHVLDTFVESQRVGLQEEPRPGRHDSRTANVPKPDSRPKRLRPYRSDAHHLTDTGLRVLQMLAAGKKTSQVAKECGCNRMHIVRFRKAMAIYHGVNIVRDIVGAPDQSLDGLRQRVLEVSGGVRR